MRVWSWIGVAVFSITLAVPSSAGTHSRVPKGPLLIAARDGVLIYSLQGRRVQRTIIRDPRRAAERVARAEERGDLWMRMDAPVLSVERRLEGVRQLNDSAWDAMSMLVSLRLDQALANGAYRYVMFSSPRSYVLFRQASRRSRRGRFTGIEIVSRRRLSGQSEDSVLRMQGLHRSEGYVMSVADLPTPSRSAAVPSTVLLRLQDERVADSAVLARLIAVQSGT